MTTSHPEPGRYAVGDLRTFMAAPRTRAEHAPSAVLLLPMITGIDRQVEEWAEEIAETTGALALVWDPCHGPNADNTPLAELKDRLAALDDDTAIGEIAELAHHLRTQLAVERLSVIGWCLGGRYALLYGAQDHRLARVVAMHPTLSASEAECGHLDAAARSAQITAPVMLHYPGRDHIVSRASFERLQQALQSRPDAMTVIGVHPMAHHGFSGRRNQDDPHNRSAYESSWPAALGFLGNPSRPTPDAREARDD